MHERHKGTRPDNKMRARPQGFGGCEAGRVNGGPLSKSGRDKWAEARLPVPYGHKRCPACKGRTMVSNLYTYTEKVSGRVVLVKAVVCETCDGVGSVPIKHDGRKRATGGGVPSAPPPPVPTEDAQIGVEASR